MNVEKIYAVVHAVILAISASASLWLFYECFNHSMVIARVACFLLCVLNTYLCYVDFKKHDRYSIVKGMLKKETE